MEKNVLIVKNITREGPGILQEILEDRGIQSTLVDLDRGDSLPLLDEYSAVIVLGGPDSANDESEKMRDELEFVRDVISRKIPYLGICLGLQVLVKAAGGEVVKNPVREIGFRDPENHRFAVDLTETGRMDSIFDGLADRLEVFHLHGETVVLTDGTRLLASGKFCTNQVVKVWESAYGLQCHFELTPSMFEQWLAEDSDLLMLDPTRLREDFEDAKTAYTRTGRKLFENFLKNAWL